MTGVFSPEIQDFRWIQILCLFIDKISEDRELFSASFGWIGSRIDLPS